MKNKIIPVNPSISDNEGANALGWLEYNLNDQQIDYVWRCIKNKKQDYRGKLAGHLSASYSLFDRADWFFKDVISPLLDRYATEYENLARKFPTRRSHPVYMQEWWVNYQKQGEFNPLHDHGGVYSFVIWMKIPFDWEDQNNSTSIGGKSNAAEVSTFQIIYSNIIGETRNYDYRLSKADEGKMIFFPARLRHQVYPFYNCDEDRISVSGNIGLDTGRGA